jgi:hypothetical protein
MIFGWKPKPRIEPKLDVQTALNADPRQMNAFEKDLVRTVRKFGWQVNSISPREDEEGLAFAYTVGVWKTFGFPEILVFSLPNELLGPLLSDIVEEIRADRAPPIGRPTDRLVGNGEAALIPVAKRHYGDYLLSDLWFYDSDDFPCVQLVWPDKSNRLPWDPAFDQSFAQDQPDLSEAGWKAVLNS